MKKGLIFIYIFCFFSPVVCSQDIQYDLDKIVLNVNDYKSKVPVFKKTLNDSIEIVSLEWDFPIIPVFKSVTINEGKITSFSPLDNDNVYSMGAEDNILIVSDISSPNNLAGKVTGNILVHSKEEFHLPDYTIQLLTDQITITFYQIYGCSKYPNQTLEGECEMVYVKSDKQ